MGEVVQVRANKKRRSSEQLRPCDALFLMHRHLSGECSTGGGGVEVQTEVTSNGSRPLERTSKVAWNAHVDMKET